MITKEAEFNKLKTEKSPYLLQHAKNPVDWYPWGEEAFDKAKKEGKRFQAIVTETRPLYQGLMTAKDLLKANIPVIYCIDSAAGVSMKQATKVLTGTDLGCSIPP